MNLDFFTQTVELMTKALPCQNQEKRLSALFEFFGNEDTEVLRMAARSVAHDEEHFPTPKTFSSYVERFKNRTEGQLERALCSKCDGYGWVFTKDGVMRGTCIHGEKISDKVAQAPRNYTKIPRQVSDDEILQGITGDPKKFVLGFKKTSRLMKISHPEFYSKIKGLVVDLVGKDRIKTILEEAERPVVGFHKP